MVRFSWILLILVMGGACSHRAEITEADLRYSRVMEQELLACQQRYPKREKGSVADSIRCTNTARQKNPAIFSAGGNADLIRLADLKSVEAGERYDTGKLTDSQLDLELATIQNEFVAFIEARSGQRAIVSAAQQQADAASQQTALARSKAFQDAIAPKQTTTNCSTFGNTMSCRSY